MVAASARPQTGMIAPFDPFRHLGPVVELIGLTFAGELGPGARHTLRRMQRVVRWRGLGLWRTETGLLGAPGFVWLEGDRRVVGNVSLRRAASPGGWIIGNVAVHPNWQGRGIGQALVEAAVEMAAERGGAWMGLEVRETNSAARHLYEGMGFEPVGTMLELIQPAGSPWPRTQPATIPLRQARAADSGTLYRLAQEGLSRPHRETLEVRPSLYRAGWEARLDGWLAGYREDWWVVEEEEEEAQVVGALRVNSRWPARWHWLEVLVRQERLDDLGPPLAAAGLAALSHRQPWEVTTVLPGPREALEPAFVAAGFRRLRHLIQMRLILGQRVRVVG